ncbi:CSS-motif domain-containing protein [Pseudomonas typographi]|uniref:Putative cyclic diguanylate phosphodiesterase CSS motif-containing domain-containing protein n=1 Tax=Pseudomonas typographi TaxID=2715964 RepID=A0ABR7Z8R9_9PSED|nr:CSS-motif domain-containing protein [Pseudomonas typographi]MBD1553869.1 hypothetical protein [Pseudomonas typographi]MBD1601704.1 hypothetical protein [Pseudomonas typographi]
MPLIIGMAVSFFTIEHSLQEKNKRVITAALSHFDDLFTQLAASATQADPWLTASCDALVASAPAADTLPELSLGFLRLARNDCTAPEPQLPSAKPAATTWLSINAQDPASPARGALLLNRGTPERFVSVVVDNQWVIKWMKLISGDTYLSLRIAGTILWDDGAMLSGNSTDNQQYSARARSTLWPYEVESTLSSDDVLDTIRSEWVMMLARLSVLAVICAGLCHWALTRRHR